MVKKFKKGYPQDNIIFSDDITCVLWQHGQEVMRCPVDDTVALEKLLKLFFGYERPEIADFARQNLERAGVANVTIEIGDGANGWSQRGPYDAIVVSGALPSLPAALLKQLRVGGRLAAIVGEAPVMEAQLVICSADGAYNTVNLFETVVPVLDGGETKNAFSF